MPIAFDRAAFAVRLARARRERFGADGVEAIAEALGIPARTWENYESGVVIPDVVMLRFLCLTGVDPPWLLADGGIASASPTGPIILPG